MAEATITVELSQETRELLERIAVALERQAAAKPSIMNDDGERSFGDPPKTDIQDKLKRLMEGTGWQGE